MGQFHDQHVFSEDYADVQPRFLPHPGAHGHSHVEQLAAFTARSANVPGAAASPDPADGKRLRISSAAARTVLPVHTSTV